MSPQVWWYFARASGIVAWVLLTLAVLWGIVLSTDLFPRWRRKPWLLDLHRWLGALSLMTLAVHLGSLMADSYIEFNLADLAVPFASEFKPWQVALGVFAMWGLVVIEVSSLLMKRLPRRLWRGIHLTSYLVFVLTSLHGTFVGTDATTPMYLATTALTTSALGGALTYRILTRRPKRQARVRPVTSDDTPSETDPRPASPTIAAAPVPRLPRAVTARNTSEPTEGRRHDAPRATPPTPRNTGSVPVRH